MPPKGTTRTRPAPLPEDDDAFVRLPDVLRVLPVGKNTFLNGVREGRYPKAFKLSARVLGWRVRDIRALLVALAASD